MRSVIFLIFAFIGFSVAFPEFHFLDARKEGKNGTMKGMMGNNTKNSLNKECRTMARLTRITNLANNQTAIDALTAKGKLNATSVTELKSKASEAATKLATMTSNTTLVSECAVFDANRKTMGQCNAMKRLTKLSALASNQTAMDAKITKMKLNDTEATAFKAFVAKAETKLKDLQSNTTLTGICAKETSGKGSTTQAGTAAASSGKSSAAVALTLQSMPVVFIPALGAIIALFL